MQINSNEAELKSRLIKIKNMQTNAENKRVVLKFDEDNTARGLKTSTRLNLLGVLHKVLKFAENKAFSKFIRSDINEFLERVKQGDFRDEHYKYRHTKDKFKASVCRTCATELDETKALNLFYPSNE